MIGGIVSVEVPEGWYPDVNAPGTERYWDGQSWTDQVRSTPLPPPPPVAATPPNPPAPSPDPSVSSAATPTGSPKPARKSPTTAVVVGAVVVVLVVLVAIGAAVATNSMKNSTSTTAAAGAESAESPEPGPSATRARKTCEEWRKEVDSAPSNIYELTLREARNAGCDVVDPVQAGGNTENLRDCTAIQADYLAATKNGNDARALKLRAEGKKSACTLQPYKGSIADRPAASSLPSMDGIAYKWAENPNCGYFRCFGMTVRADDQSCPNGLYVEINLLDRNDNVVAYSNDVVGALNQGQKAKLIFDVTDDSVRSAQLNEISCY